MKITVTLKDIAAGLRYSGESCPIALAINRARPKRYVSVCGDEITIGKINYAVPRIVVDFIDKFDERKPVHPISFNLVRARRT